MDTLTKIADTDTSLGKKLSAILCAVSLTAASSMALAENDATASAFRDGWREGKLETIFLLNPHLNNFALDAEISGETLILTGTVKEAIDRDLAEAIAESIDGIKSVENRIVVKSEEGVTAKADTETEDKDSTLSQRIQDITTTTTIKGKLLKSPHIAGLAINVDTSNGHVTLTGEVESSAARDLAWRLAKNTRGVVEVRNNLDVVAPQDS